MENWSVSLSNLRRETFSTQNHEFIVIDGFMEEPETAHRHASLQNFAKITPQYPGVRAPLPEAVAFAWLETLTPLLDQTFGTAEHGWQIQAWYSIVTARPAELIPLQRFPHVDGTDPRQLAMMLYLHQTDHGGTAFFRHRATGFEALNEDTYLQYRAALEKEVGEAGLPAAAYVTDGSPFFERIHASEGAFNQAVFYRGNLLHSGIIDNNVDLPADPRTGRLTINAFFRPIAPKAHSQ